ncbi:MAG: T9SS type A sorting domain-containing protein, partial [Bacteroidota bacterium]
DSVIPSSTNNVVSNSSRGFIFQPNVDIMVLHFGKREPTGTQRYVTLWDVASQTIIHQDSVTGGVGVWNYKQLQEPIFLTQGTSYILTLFQGQGDGYYFGTSTQIGQHLTYGGSMRYCNNCTENTYPTQTLNNYHYGTPDFWYYLPNFASVAPTYTWGTELEADAGADDNLCGAQTINLSGQIAGGIGGTTTTWSPGTSVSDSTILNPTATISTATAFALTVVDGDGCTDTDSVFYTVIAAPTADLGNDSTVCGGNIMLDAGAGNYSYMWSTGDTSQMITASMTGNYGVTITDNSTGCTATDDVNLNFGGNVSVSLGADTTLCDGNTLTLDAGAGYSAYNWSNAGTNQTITIAIGGSYSVIVTDSSGCTASDTIDVVVVQSPTVTLPADTVICPDDSIMLSAPAGFTYMWSTGGTGMTELVTMAGTYGVTITDQNGCTDNDEIVIDTCTLIGVANAFALANNMDVLPNPYNGEAKIVLRLTSATSGTIMLHDLSGRVVWSVEPREYGAGEHTLDLSTTELANGTYYLRFNAQDGMLAKRVVLAR